MKKDRPFQVHDILISRHPNLVGTEFEEQRVNFRGTVRPGVAMVSPLEGGAFDFEIEKEYLTRVEGDDNGTTE